MERLTKGFFAMVAMRNWKSKMGGSSPRAAQPSSSAAPRGIVLLIVLVLLTLFGLIAVAFVMLSGHARRNAQSIERFEQTTESPEKLVHRAVMQVLRGSGNTASSMGAHSLLEDIYGDDSESGTISASATACGGQLLRIESSVAANEILRRLGSVLTITDTTSDVAAQRALIGQSTRVLYAETGSTAFYVQAFPSGTIPASGAAFTINGVPFSGTGFGYRPANRDLNEPTTVGTLTLPAAIVPNCTANRNPPGEANEDYDAADFQNMLLAAQVYNSSSSVTQTIPSLHRPSLMRYVAGSSSYTMTPEMLRLITLRPVGAITAGTVSSGTATSCGTATVTFTGTPDHPDFTGSNPNYNPAWDGRTAGQGQWDVDNDGDGTPDSVWVDLGESVRTTSDGRLYKPLFAILCVDLDGRINLNAHGSRAQLVTIAAGSATEYSLAGGAAPSVSCLGQGFGPAEINPYYVLGGTAAYSNILIGGTATTGSGDTASFQGRYGSNGTPGGTVTSYPSAVLANKWFNFAQNYGYGASYWASCLSTSTYTTITDGVNCAGAYGSPVDPFGVGVVGLDVAGRPVYCGGSDTGAYLGYGCALNAVPLPYELNLSSSAARGLSSTATTADNPFSPAELERLLRPYDRDAASLPERLLALTGGTASALLTKSLQKTFTTESWDLPCPATVGLVNTAGTAGLGGGFADFAKAWLVKRGVDASAAPAMLSTLLPPDLLAGLKMNINRPLGNGRDNEGFGVVDTPEPVTVSGTVTLSGTTSAFNYSETGAYKTTASASETTTTALAARQLEARYLYVLLCMTADLDYLKTRLGTTAATARYLAQWAVNAVDFRDRDSIMTPFDYDPTFAESGGDLSGGWSPPCDALHRVWGCERPELLITETLAFHDRRTEDTENENDAVSPEEGTGETDSGLGKAAKYYNDGGVHNTSKDYDASFDQTYRPQGSLFVELYNPQSPLEPRSGDFYSASNGDLVLSQVSGTVTASGATVAKGSPVWRLAIATDFQDTSGTGTTNKNEPLDPDDPDTTKRPTIEREVYFVSTTNASLPTKSCASAEGQFFTSSTATYAVAPGGYAVIGPGERASSPHQSSDIKRTYLGFLVGKTAGDDNTHYVDLSTRTSADPFVVHNNEDTSQPAASSIGVPTTLAIDSSMNSSGTGALPHRLSASEPLSYTSGTATYKDYDAMAGSVSETSGKYATPFDWPFDMRRSDADKDKFLTNGTKEKYRMIYLQRLANPLLPYDATSNPYRTIDCMAVDLTVFNGLVSAGSYREDAPNSPQLRARQRGEKNDDDGNQNLWKQEPIDKPSDWTTSGTLSVQHYFDYQLTHSLGYLNEQFSSGTMTSLTNGVTGVAELGLPPKPFPWLTWLNRPYANPLELLLVPACRSSKLLTNGGTSTSDSPNYDQYYRILTTSTGTATDPYAPALGTATSSLANEKVPYPHLMNFFQSSSSTPTGTSPQFHRLFEFLAVPSPFIGTETWLNPSKATSPLLPPFNRISAYREPGRINLNTVYGGTSSTAWRGLMSGLTGMAGTAPWVQFVKSRRGFDAAVQSNVLASVDASGNAYPSEFMRPFRSFGGWKMTPDALRPTSADQNREINYTLFRADPDNANRPLFRPSTLSTDADDNAYRNPYFHYQGLMRLGNLVTTRSNVYAVWITVGYFEVAPTTVGTAHPDGYQLGRELNTDTGDIKRHRAFYIIDRSIPVGFQRGKDLNAEKAILINRFIE